MARISTNDILAILRKYELAGELSSQKAIHDVKAYPERILSSLNSFTFEKTRYYLLTNSSVADDPEVALEHIKQDISPLVGVLSKNPIGGRQSYGMPFKGKDVYLFAVRSAKQRLDLELARRYPALSRSTIQKYIKAGHVRVNDEEVIQPKYEIRDTDTVAMIPPEKSSFDGQELPILYIDDNVIVINKPAGILTHSKGVMNDEFTAADFFRRYTTNGLETTRPGIVHRLDRDTSGVMIGARNDETALLLKKQFADRKVKKRYVAVVDGVPKTEEAVIDLPIGRNPSAPSTFRIDPSGKTAQTTYRVVASTETQSLVLLQPKTGRTHQLRVHLQYINTPINGDRVYGRPSKTAQRLFLHAYSLELTLPDSKRTVFSAPVPSPFMTHFPGAVLDD